MNTRFVILALCITGAMAALMQFTFPYLADRPLPNPAFHIVLGIFFVAYLAGYFFLNKKLEGSAQKFVNAFMMVSSVRMLLCAGVMVLVIIKNKDVGKFLAIYYVVCYLALLGTEVSFLFKKSKAIK